MLKDVENCTLAYSTYTFKLMHAHLIDYTIRMCVVHLQLKMNYI
jgi:hypothetical protein